MPGVASGEDDGRLAERPRSAADLTLDEAYGVDHGRDEAMRAATSSGDWREDEPSAAAVPKGEQLPQKLVLVVEDDEAVSSLLVALLEDRGYAAVPAMDGRTAIELARKLTPHLITLDLALPGTDGH